MLQQAVFVLRGQLPPSAQAVGSGTLFLFAN